MRARRWIGVVAVGVAAVGGCSDDDDSASGSAAVTAGEVQFEDALDDDSNGWGEDSSEDGTLAYEDGDYVWTFRTGPFAHFLAETLDAAITDGSVDGLDVVVRADGTLVEGGGVIGVFCREVADDDAEAQWYEFVARDGFAAIRIADLEGNLEVLAETDSVTVPAGSPTTIEGGCVDEGDTAHLTLSIDGEQVLDASDDTPLGEGPAGLQAYATPDDSDEPPLVVRWHEFAVHTAVSS